MISTILGSFPVFVQEIFDVLFMTVVVGFIFMKLINRRQKFEWNTFLFSCMAIAPAIILHELGHKLVAIFFGYSAVFHAAYFWLFIGLILVLVGSPIIFFVPAFVSISCTSANCVNSPGVLALIAFAGPFVNLLLFFLALIVLKTHKDLSKRSFAFWHLTKLINIFLFVFNMLPIPGFDGSKVFAGLIHVLF
jgi:Zn-dependent protease